ncbi:MAG: hypothetical protein IAE95_14255 [Chitinophagaceae bacterium]|nr:hypothetical protein [Chitinophagaceae bacterium]
MYPDDQETTPGSEDKFLRIAATVLVLVVALTCVSDIQTTVSVMRTGWDGSAGSILSPHEARIFYTCCSLADALLLVSATYFLLRSRRKAVLLIFMIFLLVQAVAGVTKYMLTDGQEHQMERNHILSN